MKNNNYSEEHALTFLPNRLREAVRKSAALYHGTLSEVRLRAERAVFIHKNPCAIIARLLSEKVKKSSFRICPAELSFTDFCRLLQLHL